MLTRLRLINRKNERLDKRISKLNYQDRNFAYYRLSIVALSILLGFFSIYHKSDLLAIIAVFNLFVVFGFLTFIHGRIKKAIERGVTAKALYTQQINRLNLNWNELPKSQYSAAPEHPYGYDLDIYGPHSLLRLLDQTSTIQSEEILANWILFPEEDRLELFRRQKVVKQLQAHTAFRNKLFRLNLRDTHTKMDSKSILSWLENYQYKAAKWRLPVLTLLALTTAVFYLSGFIGFPNTYWFHSLALYVVIHLLGQLQLNAFFINSYAISEDVRPLKQLFHFLQSFKVKEKSALAEYVRPFQQIESQPLKKIRKLNLHIALVGMRMNPVMTILLNIALPWDYIVAHLLNKSVQQIKTLFPQWLKGWHQLEALSALAQFGWLNSHYTFPVLEPFNAGGKPRFSALEMGHPLINGKQRIHNQFSIEKENRINLITGSNMSGKSTFLRTVGVNLVLARAGAVVCAKQLNTTLLDIKSCIRINDSLSEGLSYFYAEVKRLKMILQEIEAAPKGKILFLVDEIFKGTNNRERFIGSHAFITAMDRLGAPGFVTTHDLELAELEKSVEDLKNYHFKEEIKAAKMVFDYTIRTGPSPTTNALKIMELEGLPIKP